MTELQTKTTEIGDLLVDNPTLISQLLDRLLMTEPLSIELREWAGYFKCKCPKCGGPVSLRYSNARDTTNKVFWTCCDKKCQGQFHSSFLGLYRCFQHCNNGKCLSPIKSAGFILDAIASLQGISKPTDATPFVIPDESDVPF
jgi:hypothetical protein